MQFDWILHHWHVTTCNVGHSTFNVVFGISLSVLGFRAMCAIYGRPIQHPGIQIGKIQVGNGNQGSQIWLQWQLHRNFSMLFAWRYSCFANKRHLMELLLANTYEFLAIKAPKHQIGFPVMVKTTCSPLPFFRS